SPGKDELLKAKKKIIAAQTSAPDSVARAEYKEARPSSLEEYQILKKMFAAGKNQQAIIRALSYLREKPNDWDVRFVLGQHYFQQKQYDLAYKQFNLVLSNIPNYTDVRVQLINLYIATNRLREAKGVLAAGRALQPNNLDLFSLEGTIAFQEARFARAADIARSVLAKDPTNQNAKALKANLDSSSPRYMIGRNTVGISQQAFYASDRHQVWDFTTLYYGRDTDYGIIYGKINYNNRFLKSASQAEIDAWPILNKYVSFNLNAAYANEPTLFPRVLGGAEAYVSIPRFAQVSLGGKYHRVTNSKAFHYYTGSITKEIINNLITFKPYFYQTNPGPRSILYTGLIRHYLRGNKDHYINLNVLAGRSPDLFDLTNISFVTTSLKGASIDYAFPILNHTIVVDIGAGYTEQKYPNGLNRKLTGGTIRIEKRFE
ncbi:MAG: YaiO family outer membrane beta-barrel protein, partial [Tatlockia sp.]|nr:YaiO family outer membrane beta-barrel protein [Tatlockia sp.]